MPRFQRMVVYRWQADDLEQAQEAWDDNGPELATITESPAITVLEEFPIRELPDITPG